MFYKLIIKRCNRCKGFTAASQAKGTDSKNNLQSVITNNINRYWKGVFHGVINSLIIIIWI